MREQGLSIGQGISVMAKHKLRNSLLVALLVGVASHMAFAEEAAGLKDEVARQARALEGKLIERRRDIHAHPELGNQETRTAQLVADHLRHLGMEVRTGVARTGVVGILRGGRSGPVIALRADMDALPVKETLDLPFASKAKSTYLGKEVDVMHACGHDSHVAILMTVAEILAGLRDRLPGTVAFYFQPAEGGAERLRPGRPQHLGSEDDGPGRGDE